MIELLTVADDGTAAVGQRFAEKSRAIQYIAGGENISTATLCVFGFKSRTTIHSERFYVPGWLMKDYGPSPYACKLAAERMGWR